MKLYDIAKTIRRPADLTARGSGGKAHKASPFITDGLEPQASGVAFAFEDGIVWLEPRDLIELEVPRVEVDESVEGYQRVHYENHVRNMARSMMEGRLFPAITVTTDGKIVEGQHRALAGVMARMAVRTDVRELTPLQQKQLFADQGKARSVSKSTLVLSGDDPISEYVQDVFTSPSTPWEGLVDLHGHGRKFSPAGLAENVAVYASDSMSRKVTRVQEARFSPQLADELAQLYRAFGTPATNPGAFVAVPRRAIARAALMILVRGERRRDDLKRWSAHMGKFDFSEHPHVRSTKELSVLLIKHWNKRLPKERRIDVEDD